MPETEIEDAVGPDDEGNDDEATTQADPERWPIPAKDPEEEPVHEGAEYDPPAGDEDGT